jgi:hypothetical protein
VGAVRRAERVVDEDVAELRVPRRQPLVVLRLAGVEPDVLQEHDVRVGGHLVAQRHERDAEALGDRPQRQLRVRPLRPPEVRHEHEPGALAAQLVDRRLRGADAGVVGDRAVVGQRDVEVRADEDAPAGDVAEGVERPHAVVVAGTRTCCTRSARRFE